MYSKIIFYEVIAILNLPNWQWQIKEKRKKEGAEAEEQGIEWGKEKGRKKKYWLRSLINVVEQWTHQTCFTTKVQRCFDIQNLIKFMA